MLSFGLQAKMLTLKERQDNLPDIFFRNNYNNLKLQQFLLDRLLLIIN